MLWAVLHQALVVTALLWYTATLSSIPYGLVYSITWPLFGCLITGSLISQLILFQIIRPERQPSSRRCRSPSASRISRPGLTTTTWQRSKRFDRVFKKFLNQILGTFATNTRETNNTLYDSHFIVSSSQQEVIVLVNFVCEIILHQDLNPGPSGSVFMPEYNLPLYLSVPSLCPRW